MPLSQTLQLLTPKTISSLFDNTKWDSISNATLTSSRASREAGMTLNAALTSSRASRETGMRRPAWRWMRHWRRSASRENHEWHVPTLGPPCRRALNAVTVVQWSLPEADWQNSGWVTSDSSWLLGLVKTRYNSLDRSLSQERRQAKNVVWRGVWRLVQMMFGNWLQQTSSIGRSKRYPLPTATAIHWLQQTSSICCSKRHLFVAANVIYLLQQMSSTGFSKCHPFVAASVIQWLQPTSSICCSKHHPLTEARVIHWLQNKPSMGHSKLHALFAASVIHWQEDFIGGSLLWRVTFQPLFQQTPNIYPWNNLQLRCQRSGDQWSTFHWLTKSV